MSQTHTTAITVTGSTVDSGTTSETPRLDITAEMPTAGTDISEVSSKLNKSQTPRAHLNGFMCNVHDDREH